MSPEPKVAEEEQEDFLDREAQPVGVPDDTDIEVEVVDDVPEEDQGRPVRAPDEDDDGDFDENEYGNRVKKRIQKLRYEWNEERRAKEQVLRENNEAVRYAQSIQAQNQALSQQLTDQRRLLYDQVSAKTDAEIEGAKRLYKEAYESGDSEQIVDAQGELARLHAERSQFMYQVPLEPPPPQHPELQQPAQAQAPPPDPIAVDWLKKNPWFQQAGYEEMTGFAVGIHEKLVKQGVDPRSNSTYYEQIDGVLRQRFPDYFGKGNGASQAPTSRKTPVVASAKRGGGKPRKVELTGTQVELARKLGLTNAQYAAQVVKEMTNG
jgi:hypothetical protein